MNNLKRAITFTVLILTLAGCKPEAPPSDLLETQTEALERAKAVDGQLQKQAEEQKKLIEEVQP